MISTMSKEKIVMPTDEEVAAYSQKAESSETKPGNPGPEETNAPPQPEQPGQQTSGSATEEERETAEEYKDKYLRAVAELSNYRKRVERDREESLRYANTGLVRSLIPVLDDLERVVTSAGEHPGNTEAILDGVKLTISSFRKALSDHQVHSIEAEAKPFDPAVHEAMMQQPDDRYDVPTVLQVLQEGFTLCDRVIRPARVVVSKPPEVQSDEKTE